MGARYRQNPLAADNPAQGLGAMKNLEPSGPRLHEFGVFLPHSTGENHGGGLTQVGRVMADSHGDARALQGFGHLGGRSIRPRDAEATLSEDTGNPAHPRAPDTNEVHCA